LNDIFFSEINTCKKNGNLMFTQVSMQCSFTCATSILGERKWDLICHIWMLLASYHPCIVSFIWIIYPTGDIGARDQCGLLNAHFHNAFHNLISYEPTFLHFMCACSVLQSLSWISTLTNQFVDLKAFLFPKRTNISMPHGNTQLMLVRLGLNVALVEALPSTNRQQHTMWIHKLLCMYCISFYHI
jgi:hypothetical protein